MLYPYRERIAMLCGRATAQKAKKRQLEAGAMVEAQFLLINIIL
jgi:hypothetical protein